MRILWISIFFLIFVPFAHPQCCLRFQGKKCAECPVGTHLFRGNCIIDIKDCSVYKDGFDCSTCNSGFQLNSQGECQKISSTPAPTSSQQASVDFTDFTETFINLNNMQAPNSEYYLLADEYLRSTRPQILEATTIGARVRVFKNRTAEVTIEYLNKNIYYRAVMQIGMDTYILQEKSFGKVTALILDQANQNTSNSTSTLKIDSTLLSQSGQLSLINPQHLQKLKLLENYLLSQNQPIAIFKNGNFTILPDGSFNISSVYGTKSQNADLIIKGIISKDNSVKIIEIKNLLKSPEIQIPQQKTKPYMDLNIGDMADQNYLISKDLIWSQFSQLNGIQPSSGKKYTQSSIINYLMRFTKGDGSIVDIQISFDSTNFIGKVGKVTQISPPTKNPAPPGYVKVDSSQIYKDIYFIVVFEYINKQSNNKYKETSIRSVQKYENGPIINYRINFETSNFVWQVVASINPSTFVSSGFTENQKQPLINSIVNNSSNSNSSSSKVLINSDLLNKVSTDDSLNNSQQNKPQNITLNNQNKTSNNIIQNTATNNQPTLNSTSNQINNQTNQTNQPIKIVIESINSTNATVQTNSIQTNSTVQINSTNQNQTISNKSSTFVSQNSSSSSSAQSKQQTANNVIQELTNGLTALSKTDMNTVQFRQIDSLLRMANQSELKNSIIVGAYFKSSSFTKNYQIYYMQQQGSQDIFAAVVSRDQLRKRTYIISFGKLGY